MLEERRSSSLARQNKLARAELRQGIPSRLVVFPDEGHWIGKPQNQRLWWNEVQGWLSKYLAGKTAS